MDLIKTLLRTLHGPIYQRRIEVLAGLIAPLCRESDQLLDIGCGNGRLATAIASHQEAPRLLHLRGVEKHPRGGEEIPVDKFNGRVLPYESKSFDIVLLADVLHHEEEHNNLLREALRVGGRFCILKDHKQEGFLAFARICLMDWAANKGYDVKCLFDYPTHAGWLQRIELAGGQVLQEWRSLPVYPAPWNWAFGGPLHYLAVITSMESPQGRESASKP
jgi:SAM-dependent methyltransferase